jgi:hypothetical protein
MEAGHYATGCPALAESFRLDPKAGALFTLAECEAKWGRIASASAHYDDYVKRLARMTPAQRAMQGERERVATGQLEALKKRVPTLAVILPPAPAGTVVTKDGVVMGEPSLGTPLPIDPGEHVIVVRTPGGGVYETKVVVAENESKKETLVVPSDPAPARSIVDTPPPPVTTNTRTPWILGAFGGALAGTAVGTVTGILVLDKKSVIDANCADTACNPDGLAAADAAETLGAVSTVSFAVAGVALAAGIVLLVTSPSKTTTSTSLLRW